MNADPTKIDSQEAQRFVERYGQAWNAWDIDGFLDLFTGSVVYASHPKEIVVGHEPLRTYLRKEETEQGVCDSPHGQYPNGLELRLTGWIALDPRYGLHLFHAMPTAFPSTRAGEGCWDRLRRCEP